MTHNCTYTYTHIYIYTYTQGRTPLNDRSARRRGRYLHNTQDRNKHAFRGIWIHWSSFRKCVL